MKAVVTGYCGFIGGWLTHQLLALGFEVVGIDIQPYSSSTPPVRSAGAGKPEGLHENFTWCIADVRMNVFDMAEAMRGAEVVFHLAGRVTASDQCDVAHLETNDLGTLNVLMAAKSAGVKRVVFTSSCAVYGSTNLYPVRECDHTAPLTPYATSKLCAEKWCNLYHARGDLETVILRLFNVYGPYQNPGYAAVIQVFIQNALKAEKFTVFGDGNQVRDFVHVLDVVDALLRAAKLEKLTHRLFNIGTGIATRIGELPHFIATVAGRPGEYEIENARERSGDIRFSCNGSTLAETCLAWHPIVDLELGLRNLLEDERNRKDTTDGR